MSNEPGRWLLSDLKQLIECSTAADGHVISTLRSIATLLEDEGNSNFVLGKVIIKNDLRDDDNEDEENE